MICLVIAGLIGISLFTDLLSVDGIIFNKFSQKNRPTTVARMGSIFVNLEIWERYPLFGAGLTKVGELFPNLCGKMFGFVSEHNTNTLLCELATYGIVYTAIFVVGYARFFKLLANKKFETLLICGIFCTFSW